MCNELSRINMKRLLTFVLTLFVFAVHAQEFTIKTLELTATQIVIHYDLVDSTKGRTYTVFVYSSVDNFLNPLTKVSGDAALEVKPGMNKKIMWNAKEELGPTFDGEVALEVRGQLYVPFIRFEGFEDVVVRKRKTPFILKWSGGTRQNILNFQLYQGESLVYTYPNIPNQSEYEIEIPNRVKPGSGYYFRISDSKNKDQVVITPKFTVKRKISLGVKALVLAGVGTAVWILTKPDPAAPEVEGPPNTP